MSYHRRNQKIFPLLLFPISMKQLAAEETDTTYGLFVTLFILSHNGSLVLLPIWGCQPVEEQQTVRAAGMCLVNFAIVGADICSGSCLLLCNLAVNAERKSGAVKSHDPRACQRFCEKSLLVTPPMHRGTFSSQPGSWNAQSGEHFMHAHSCILISQSENELFLEHIVLLLLHKYGCEQMLSSLKCPAQCWW